MTKFQLFDDGSRPALTMVGYALHLVTVSFIGWFGSIDFFSSVFGLETMHEAFASAKETSFVLTFVVTFVVAIVATHRQNNRANAESGDSTTPFQKRAGVGGLVRTTTFIVALPSAATLVGIAFLWASSGTPEPGSTLLGLISAVLIGAGTAGNFILFQKAFYTDIYPRPSLAAKEIIGGTVLGALLYSFISWLDPHVILGAVVFLVVPGTAVLLYAGLHGRENLPATSSSDPKRTEGEGGPLRASVMSLAVATACIAVIGLVNGMLRVLAVEDGLVVLVNNLGSYGRLFSALILLLIFSINRYHFRMDVFCRWALPVLGTALLLYPALGDHGFFVTAFTYFIFSAASIVGMLGCNQAAFHYRASPVAVYCACFFIIYALQAIGYFGMRFLLESGANFGSVIDKTMFSLVALYLLFVAYALSSHFERSTGVESWNSNTLTRFDEIGQKRRMTCKKLTRMHNLTAKERETLEYLALGYSTANIAKRMVVSENTTWFHCKNIYRKLSVHSKEELLDLLEDDAAGKPT